MELDLSYRDKVGKDFSFWVKANIATNQNEIVFRDEAIVPGLEYQASTGKPINQKSYLQADGLYTSWAQLYEVDANNNPILSRPVLAKVPTVKPIKMPAARMFYKETSLSGICLCNLVILSYRISISMG